jgi:hypothetical protein
LVLMSFDRVGRAEMPDVVRTRHTPLCCRTLDRASGTDEL